MWGENPQNRHFICAYILICIYIPIYMLMVGEKSKWVEINIIIISNRQQFGSLKLKPFKTFETELDHEKLNQNHLNRNGSNRTVWGFFKLKPNGSRDLQTVKLLFHGSFSAQSKWVKRDIFIKLKRKLKLKRLVRFWNLTLHNVHCILHHL